MKQRFLTLIYCTLSYVLSAQQGSDQISWTTLDKGLHFTEYLSPLKSAIGDNKITILKIDPANYEFHLFSAKEKGEDSKTAAQWATDKKQIAVINAGMYQTDFATNLGFMKNETMINNPRVNKDNTIVAFNPKDTDVPEFQIIDRTCQDWETLKNSYHSFTQSIRMVDCNQKNKWGQQPKKWSMVVIAKDKDDNALFIFTRSPYSVHDFIATLLKAPLNIYNMMYLEGGPEASFYLDHNGTKVAKMGSYETGFQENDDNNQFWRIPNIIGISKK